MFRRAMLSTTGLISAAAVLAACSGSTTPSAPGTLPAQLLADVTGGLNQLANVLPALTATTPPVLTAAQETPLLADVNAALAFMATIGPNTPAQTGATLLSRAEGYFNAVVAGLLMVNLPSPYSTIVVAANVVVASLEAYLNSLLPPATTPPAPAAARAARLRHGMTIEKAREVLHVKPVS